MQPDILRQYLNRYLKSYNSSYTSHHVKHAVATRRLFDWLPFNRIGGVIADPNLNFAIVYTDADDITEWRSAHQPFINCEWYNDEIYSNAGIATGVGGERRRGRPSVEQAKIIKQQQWEMTKYVMEQMAAGKAGKQIARELGITPSRVSQLKRRYDEDYFLDIMQKA